MNNRSSYRGLVEVRISAYEKDLPVTDLPKFGNIMEPPAPQGTRGPEQQHRRQTNTD